VDSECYPPELEILVDGVEKTGALGQKIKFLRRIPLDPFTKSYEWGLRSYQDEPDSDSWGRENVYDVYTTHEGTALDGTQYKEW
jgi:general secretion pathway protein G